MNDQDKQHQEVMEKLSLLQPRANDAPRPARQALANLQQRIDQEQQNTLSARLQTFFFAPARRLALTAVFLLLFFGTALSFPTVRAAASDFLGLFRVQKFAAISISPEQIAMLEQIAELGLSPGELEILEEPGAATEVDSLREAQTLTGMSTIRTLPDLGEPTELFVTDGGSGRFRLDLEGTRAILEAANVDPNLLPNDIQNTNVHITIFSGVQQHWEASNISLLQTESPIVTYPEKIDQAVLGSALLQILGMSEAEANRLASQIDWTSTLLLPIPQDAASFSEVMVEGTSGIQLDSIDGQSSALVWQQNGMIHLLVREGAGADLLDLVSQLK